MFEETKISNYILCRVWGLSLSQNFFFNLTKNAKIIIYLLSKIISTLNKLKNGILEIYIKN